MAVAYCALALAVCCLLAWAGGVLPAAGSQAGPAVASCPYAFVKVRATRWAWVRRTRRVHGHRVIVRRHGKPVFVRARVHYFKRKLEPVCSAAPPGALAANLPPGSSSPLAVGAGETSHLEYVADNGLISVYDLDHAFQLVKTISLPQTNAQVRGVTMAPSTHLLFVSFGGDGPANGSGNGSVLAYDLVAERLAWEVHLKTGIDSGQVSPDGSKLYMPTGENTPTGIWSVLSASNGEVLGAIHGGAGAHNTIASNDGRYVYLGGRNSPYLDAYETATGQVKAVGPMVGTVRPFTVKGLNTLAFTGATGFDGFQVSQITTGKVLFTVSFGAVPRGFPFTAPSHGISLSPDEKQLYVIDSVHKAVQFWDVSRVSEGVAPAPLAVLPVSGLSGTEGPCAYDCGRSGWLQLSRDGRLLFVGDSGEVIDTRTRQVVTTLPTLAQTKKSIEVDWRAGVPVATSGRTGVGYVQ
ncbi:MAG TPA: hypothetical protein VNZ05_03975 [Solirubrobacteraceae bacterium]|nr:hypothetical protein [Solirubrobacteraceae bacterium]